MSAAENLQEYQADLHIHTVLSPCGSLEMSPINIVKEAARKGLDIIGITDHNASAHCKVITELAKEYGIFVLCGMEVTTSEETHCLTYFKDDNTLQQFQEIINSTILKIHNNPEKFGYQVIVNKEEEIIDQIEWLLINATSLSINEVSEKAAALGGIVIPAHIDRPSYSLTSQLGFVPPDLQVDAFEVSRFSTPEKMIEMFPYIKGATFTRTSDAHFLIDIGAGKSIFKIKNRSFDEIKMALNRTSGREVIVK